MAFPEIVKEVTYKIPNERFGMDDSEGKTSKMVYTGPTRLVLYMDKETHKVVTSWHPDEEPEQPLPLNLYTLELNSDTLEPFSTRIIASAISMSIFLAAINASTCMSKTSISSAAIAEGLNSS